jgi:hypothetical protein
VPHNSASWWGCGTIQWKGGQSSRGSGGANQACSETAVNAPLVRLRDITVTKCAPELTDGAPSQGQEPCGQCGTLHSAYC